MKRHALFLATALSVAALGAASVASAQSAAPAAARSAQVDGATPAVAGERPQRRGHGHHARRGHGPGAGMGFASGIERLDSDDDGRVSRAEFDAGQAAHAAAREVRAAARAEIEKAGTPRRASRHGGDGSAKATDKPRGPRMAMDFDAIDTNKDGYIVRTEVKTHGERMRAQMQGEHDRRFTESFAAADLNRDGKLSRVEVDEKMPRLSKRFAWMDDNRDGFLSQAELQAGARR